VAHRGHAPLSLNTSESSRVLGETFWYSILTSVIKASYSLGCHQVYTRNCHPTHLSYKKIASCARWQVAATLKRRRRLSRYSVQCVRCRPAVNTGWAKQCATAEDFINWCPSGVPPSAPGIMPDVVIVVISSLTRTRGAPPGARRPDEPALSASPAGSVIVAGSVDQIGGTLGRVIQVTWVGGHWPVIRDPWLAGIFGTRVTIVAHQLSSSTGLIRYRCKAGNVTANYERGAVYCPWQVFSHCRFKMSAASECHRVARQRRWMDFHLFIYSSASR